MENDIKPHLLKIAQYFIKDFGEEYAKDIKQRINDTIFLSVDPKNIDRIELAQELDKQLFKLSKQFCLDAGKILGIKSPNEDLSPDELNEIKFFDVLLKVNNQSDETYMDFVKFLGKLAQKTEISRKNSENFIKNDKNKEIIKNYIESLCKLYEEKYNDKMQDLSILKSQLTSTYNVDEEVYAKVQGPYTAQMRKAIASHLSKVLSKDVDKNLIRIEEFEKYFLKPIDMVNRQDKEVMSKQLSIIANRIKTKIDINEEFWQNFEKDDIRKELTQLYKERCKQLKLIPQEKDSTIEDIQALNLDKSEKEILKSKIAEYVLNNETMGFSFYTKSAEGKNIRVCILPPLKDLNDAVIFHEISHTINAPIDENVSEKYSAKSGFTLFVDDKNRENHDLDEIITDYFALKAQKIAKKDNFNICDNPDQLSVYSCAFMLFKNFFEEYTQDIQKCRMSGNPEILNQTFGKENLNALSKLATDFFNFVDIERQEEVVDGLEQKYGFDVNKIDFSQKASTYYEKQYLKFAKTMVDTLNNIKEYQNSIDNEFSI